MIRIDIFESGVKVPCERKEARMLARAVVVGACHFLADAIHPKAMFTVARCLGPAQQCVVVKAKIRQPLAYEEDLVPLSAVRSAGKRQLLG